MLLNIVYSFLDLMDEYFQKDVNKQKLIIRNNTYPYVSLFKIAFDLEGILT